MTRHYPDLGECFWLIVLRGKFDSTIQKHYLDLGSDASSVWNFCARFSDFICGKTSSSVAKCRLYSQAMLESQGLRTLLTLPGKRSRRESSILGLSSGSLHPYIYTVCSWGSKYTCVRASVIKTTSIISCPFEWTRQAYLLSSSVYLYWSVLISVFNLLIPLYSTKFQTRFSFSLVDIDLFELTYSHTKFPRKRNTLYPVLSIKYCIPEIKYPNILSRDLSPWFMKNIIS